MKTNIETNMNSDINATTSPSGFRRGRSLTAAAVILSVAALWLSYRAADQAVELYGVLDNVQATLAHEQSAKAQVDTRVQISETKSPVAGS